MVFVLFFLVAIITLGMAYGVTARSSQRRVTSWEADQRAMNLAEAAVAESITALSKGMTGSIASPAAPAYLDQGVLWVQATNLGGEVFRLQAFGMQDSGRAALDVHVERIVGNPLFFAVLNSREQLTLNADVTIDSFDSTLGTYASQAVNSTLGRPHAGTDGDVSSNACIVMNANAMVLGDATPGPGYGVSLATGAPNCIAGHLKKCVELGVTRAELQEVVATAVGVASASVVDRADIAHAAARAEIDAAFASAKE